MSHTPSRFARPLKNTVCSNCTSRVHPVRGKGGARLESCLQQNALTVFQPGKRIPEFMEGGLCHQSISSNNASAPKTFYAPITNTVSKRQYASHFTSREQRAFQQSRFLLLL